MFNDKIQSVKTHLSEYKSIYLVGIGSSIMTASIVLLVVSRSNPGPNIVQKITQIGWRNESNPTVINFVERSTPSKPVHLVGTNLYFDSLHDAARKTGHHVSMISKHVNGHIKDLNGDIFEVVKIV